MLKFHDTTFVLKHWYWNFVGGKGDEGYDFVLKKLGVDQRQIDTLRRLLLNVNCEAITIEENGGVRLRYDGNLFCQYEYIKPEKLTRLNNDLIFLDSTVFYVLTKSDLYCGDCLWQK
jgi:hypothetical protein